MTGVLGSLGGNARHGAAARRDAGDRSPRALVGLAVLALVLAATLVVSLGVGPSGMAPARVVEVLVQGPGAVAAADPGASVIVWQIRMPRVLLGALVGASLAVAGALMQGLFRNPLADPGIVGVSSGSALAVVATIVVGERLLSAGIAGLLGVFLIPAAAFAGGLAATIALYAIATRQGRTSVATMLLAGIALAALANALTGFFVFLSDDRQLRDITFWSLGGLGGASWQKLAVSGPLMLAGILLSFLLGRGLNALVLGEAEAFHLGVSVQRLKRWAIFLVAAVTGAAVATSGVIGFVGILVPHLLRLVLGADHRFLLPGAALLGAVLIVVADMVARTIAAPAELPIGILTAAIGAPFFLWMLLRRRSHLDL
ncbi:heme ABC transporter permease [Aureimonas sp. SA4125]|uniref:FecCD family ABC transporter permease n=1 Tax=Aureimonas sp. SA4125 TaxID=2826993 RepID=UPI001CC3A801|nr:iron ABC transporter permease [Aureimonas sp. SA4125]BDA85692.1 heme ABC transporter permease [Aureimonas sp. SA4125]